MVTVTARLPHVIRYINPRHPEVALLHADPGIIDRMLVLPLPVTTVRDGWDWLIVWCTVGATALAALAIAFAVVSIRRANQIAQDAQEAIVRERRNVFELGVLARLIEICGQR